MVKPDELHPVNRLLNCITIPKSPPVPFCTVITLKRDKDPDSPWPLFPLLQLCVMTSSWCRVTLKGHKCLPFRHDLLQSLFFQFHLLCSAPGSLAQDLKSASSPYPPSTTELFRLSQALLTEVLSQLINRKYRGCGSQVMGEVDDHLEICLDQLKFQALLVHQLSKGLDSCWPFSPSAQMLPGQ